MKYAMKIYNNTHKLQVPRKERRKLGPLSTKFIVDLSGCNSTNHHNLNEITRIIAIKGICYLSHATLGRRANRSQKTGFRSVHKLRDLGLLYSKYRHRDSSLYSVPALTFDPKLRDYLAPFLPCLKEPGIALERKRRKMSHQQLCYLHYVGVTQEKWGKSRPEEPPFWWQPVPYIPDLEDWGPDPCQVDHFELENPLNGIDEARLSSLLPF